MLAMYVRKLHHQCTSETGKSSVNILLIGKIFVQQNIRISNQIGKIIRTVGTDHSFISKSKNALS